MTLASSPRPPPIPCPLPTAAPAAGWPAAITTPRPADPPEQACRPGPRDERGEEAGAGGGFHPRMGEMPHRRGRERGVSLRSRVSARGLQTYGKLPSGAL